MFDAAAKFSNVIGVPLVAVTVVAFGWRWGFGLTAVLSFLYFIAFYLYLPRSQRRPQAVEGGIPVHQATAAPRPKDRPMPAPSACWATC